MNAAPGRFAELSEILEAICEERLTVAQAARLDELTRDAAAARRFYLEYIDLHGNLYWDAAQSAGVIDEAKAHGAGRAEPEIAFHAGPEPDGGPSRLAGRWKRWSAGIITVVAAALVLVLVVRSERVPAPAPADVVNQGAIRPADPAPSAGHADQRRIGISKRDEIAETAAQDAAAAPPASQANRKGANTSAGPVAEDVDREPTTIVGFIDHRIRHGWVLAGIEPSPKAGDGEWLRRVYLDVVGHIPPEEAVSAFFDDGSEKKRTALVDQLLKDSGYARNWATVWADLLVGRQPRAAGVSHSGLEKFLRDNFNANAPWTEIVGELLAAEGNADQNPAANFLLAHLNNEAAPATAMTARLFLGVQLQCTQCHDHPFYKDKQQRFWELNSFFQQTETVSHSPKASGMGAAGTESETPGLVELATRPKGGPLYYETLRGEMRAAYPVYAGHKVDPSAGVNRRRELARLITKADDRQLALALVNRMWNHFFGCGFTRPVDDMGPHNPPSHPEVLDRLAKEFIASGYDLKQLIRWICATDAYQRSSSQGSSNRADDPSSGVTPLFSRVYLKPMTAEQLYDSLLVATRAKSSARTDWNDVGRRRQDWVRQFVMSYGTDENDEATMPADSVSQALSMMNDRIVQSALSAEPGTLLYDIAQEPAGANAKIRRLCRAALSRNPTDAELSAAVENVRSACDSAKTLSAREQAETQALEDVFWAFLNANEFALVH